MTLPESVLAVQTTSEFVGRTGQRKSNAASSTIGNLEILQHLFQKLQPKNTLEIGLAYAASGTLFAELHAQSDRSRENVHTAIDPFQSTVWDDIGRMNIEANGLQSLVRVIEKFSNIALPELLNAGESFDLIYVDGSHIFEDVFIDAYYSVRLLSDGGVVVFDDASDPHVVKVIKFLETSLADRLRPLDLATLKNNVLAHKVAARLRKTQCVAFERVSDPQRPWDAKYVNF